MADDQSGGSIFPQYEHGLHCPFCDSVRLRVLRTGPRYDKPGKRYRRLICEACGKRSTSYETIAWRGDGRKDDE